MRKKTHINPNAFRTMRPLPPRLIQQLGRRQRKHILPAPQQPLPRRIINARLSLVEAFQRVLLAVCRSIATVRFQERGVEEPHERRKCVCTFFFIFPGAILRRRRERNVGSDQDDTDGEEEKRSSHDENVRMRLLRNIKGMRSHGTLALLDGYLDVVGSTASATKGNNEDTKREKGKMKRGKAG